jgi:glucose-1-phosphate cytidylyltransferase
MVEVGGRPILWHIMKLYAAQGFGEFVLAVGYKGERIKEYFLNYEAMNSDFTVRLGRPHEVQYHRAHAERDWVVTLADTGLAAQTGARIAKAARYLPADDDVFFATYGDGVADIDLNALLAFHRAHGRLATVTGVRPPSRFGELLLDGDRVREFSEKPLGTQGRINGGFFVFSRGFLRYVTADDGCILERGPLERAAADGQLAMYAHDGFWQCMDTLRDTQLLQREWDGGHAPWKKWKDGP